MNERFILKDKKSLTEAENTPKEVLTSAAETAFEPYATTQDQTDPMLEGMRVLLNRIEQNEQRMNTLCQRLSLLDPSFKNQSNTEQPFSEAELKILDQVRRECEAQTTQSKV